MLSKPIEYSYRVLSTYLAVMSVGVCMSTVVCSIKGLCLCDVPLFSLDVYEYET